jgi:hypothetical protein
MKNEGKAKLRLWHNMQHANKGTHTQHQSDVSTCINFISNHHHGRTIAHPQSPAQGRAGVCCYHNDDALAAVACGLPSAPDESTRQRWGVGDAAGEQLLLDENGAA